MQVHIALRHLPVGFGGSVLIPEAGIGHPQLLEREGPELPGIRSGEVQFTRAVLLDGQLRLIEVHGLRLQRAPQQRGDGKPDPKAFCRGHGPVLVAYFQFLDSQAGPRQQAESRRTMDLHLHAERFTEPGFELLPDLVAVDQQPGRQGHGQNQQRDQRQNDPDHVPKWMIADWHRQTSLSCCPAGCIPPSLETPRRPAQRFFSDPGGFLS